MCCACARCVLGRRCRVGVVGHVGSMLVYKDSGEKRRAVDSRLRDFICGASRVSRADVATPLAPPMATSPPRTSKYSEQARKHSDAKCQPCPPREDGVAPKEGMILLGDGRGGGKSGGTHAAKQAFDAKHRYKSQGTSLSTYESINVRVYQRTSLSTYVSFKLQVYYLDSSFDSRR